MKKLFLLLGSGLLPGTLSAQLVINEFFADPAADLSGDANGDGVRSATDDEFVELVNTSGSAIDIGGWTISDGVQVRHTFADSTVIEDGQVVLVFGGGTPTGSFGGALVTTSSLGGLGLNNSGDSITLADGVGVVVASASYADEGSADTSLTLSPDLTGTEFVQHSSLGDGTLLFSPGTTSAGNPFGGDSLILSIDPNIFSEGDGAGVATGTVTRTGDLIEAVTVTLESSDTSELSVPPSVFIAAGQASVDFTVDAVDDDLQDGEQSVTVTATTDGFFAANIAVTVVDNEDPIPTIDLSADPVLISENGGVSMVTIEVSEASADGYTFDLSSSDESELTVPAMVEILPDETMATFTVTAVDDPDVDGGQTVTVTASDSSSFIESGTLDIVVTDDEAFAAPDIVINELRVDNAGLDTEEYVEIFGENADYNLDRVWLIVLGDLGGSDTTGNIDRAFDLSGLSATGNYFLIANDNIAGGTADLSVGTNIFENGDSETFLLVTDFVGSTGDDLDTNNDGVLDSMPWGSVIDAVSIVEPGDAPAVVGFGYAESLGFLGANVMAASDSTFVPAHAFRSPDGSGEWFAGPFGSEEDPAIDTPGSENGVPVLPPVAELPVIESISVNGVTGVVVLSIRGLGTDVYGVQSSTDIGVVDSWNMITGNVNEQDDGDLVNFVFSDAESITAPKLFYRLIRQ